MEEEVISIEDIIFSIVKRYKLIVIITLISTLCGVAIVTFKNNVSYRATAKIFAGKTEEIQATYSTDEILDYQQLLATYTQIASTDDFISDVLYKTGINKTVAEIKSGLTYVASIDAPIIEIGYVATDPEEAKLIVEAISSMFGEQIQDIILNTYTRVIESAKVKEISESKTMPIAIAFLLGLFVSLGLVFLLEYLDNTVKTKEHLMQISPDIPVIGVISMNKDDD